MKSQITEINQGAVNLIPELVCTLDFKAPTSDIQPLTSNFEPPTLMPTHKFRYSNIKLRTSKLEHPLYIPRNISLA
jgi:hypothetical protein